MSGATTTTTSLPSESELFSRFSKRIRLYGLRHLRDSQAAEDLVQDVLLTTLEKLRAGEIRELDRLPSFVLGTCRMRVSNQRRTDRRRSELLQTHAEDAKPAPLREPVHPLDSRRLAHCLAELSERARAVLLLTFYAEQTSRQAAAELRVSTENVRVLRHRAVTRLHACMQPREDA